MSRIVLSSISKFAFADIVALYKEKKTPFMCEIDSDNIDEKIYKDHLEKDAPKIEIMYHINGVHEDEFKDRFIRNYIFDEMTHHKYIRVGSLIYELNENQLPPYDTFFDDIQNLNTYNYILVNEYQKKQEHDFIIFRDPVVEIKDIKKFSRFVSNRKLH